MKIMALMLVIAIDAANWLVSNTQDRIPSGQKPQWHILHMPVMQICMCLFLL